MHVVDFHNGNNLASSYIQVPPPEEVHVYGPCHVCVKIQPRYNHICSLTTLFIGVGRYLEKLVRGGETYV